MSTEIIPRTPITVRVATMSDFPFIDALQKMHSFMVGFLQRKAIEQKIEAGQILIAETMNDEVGTMNGRPCTDAPRSSFIVPTSSLPLGYVISQDKYSGRDDIGIVYQLNVIPLRQRHLIGATLVKAAFERAAYGCRLFCCWCAQDLQANFFWESLGFVPIAFRTGSRSKQRAHIFWQRRVRENDQSTPYWYPCETKNGSIREDRLVLPIPPGVHWRDAKPVVIPGLELGKGAPLEPLVLPEPVVKSTRPEQPQLSRAQKAVIQRSQSKHLKGVPLGRKAVITATGIKYVERTDYVEALDAPEELAIAPKPKKPRKPAAKNDPKLTATVRELRDRFLEEINAGTILPNAKYEVSRLIGDETRCSPQVRALPDAA